MKKKKNNNYLYYIGLVILVILLLLPPGLRLFASDLYVEEEEKVDVIKILSCNKVDESISSSFVNEIPQNIDYKIKGDYRLNDYDANVGYVEEVGKDVIKSTLMPIIRPFAKITYDEVENITTFNVDVASLKEISEYESFFSNLQNQLSYYNLQAFYCDTSTY